MARFQIDATAIRDWASFHDVFQHAFKFFDRYGRNMDAWIDCMTDLHGPRALNSLGLPDGEAIEITLRGAEDLSRRCPDVLRELVECTAAVNRRYRSMKREVRIALVFE